MPNAGVSGQKKVLCFWSNALCRPTKWCHSEVMINCYVTIPTVDFLNCFGEMHGVYGSSMASRCHNN